MTNQYAGPCRTCAQWVEKGQGEYTPATKTLVHNVCPDKVLAADQRPTFYFRKCISHSQLREVVWQMENRLELCDLRDAIIKANSSKEKHILKNPNYGFAECYKILDERAAFLGLKPYSGGYYKPLEQVAVNPI